MSWFIEIRGAFGHVEQYQLLVGRSMSIAEFRAMSDGQHFEFEPHPFTPAFPLADLN